MATAVLQPVIDEERTLPEGGSWYDVHKATEHLLERIGLELDTDRAYVFHFRGDTLHNTHEWVREGTTPYREQLAAIPSEELPSFSKELRNGKQVIVYRAGDIKDVSPVEYAELMREGIQSLMLQPIFMPGSDRVVCGFVGVDSCSTQRLWRTGELIPRLQYAGNVIFALHSLSELILGSSPVPEEEDVPFNARPEYIHRFSKYLFDSVEEQRREARKRFKDSNALLSDNDMDLLGTLVEAARERLVKQFTMDPSASSALSAARDSFHTDRKTMLTPALWTAAGIADDDIRHFHELCKRRWHELKPDIEPYTHCRDVGYCRFMYRNGTLRPLKHKAFFQTKPEYNVIVGTTPRPFNRMPDDVRESPVLIKMLQTLLEEVWADELGPEVHVGVHPVRVRNFTTEEIHNNAHATLEGTHVDSTERVAVIMIERHNVAEGHGVTALYKKETPMGLRRDREEDEQELEKLRIMEVTLRAPFEGISFVDMEFKHDGSPVAAEDPSQKCWRSVCLVMCRRALTAESPVDSRVIDGYTPRSPQRRKAQQ
mmetsp:Transcript_12313/g.49372  ORF Transcript_12313/g.49372 Transcript_12313/m.49372 type:complete len:542 (-) Transcript_12313:183-1808(-)|eukprot:CAMPEP_0114624156 /NCGR_PEP_ID=MMETSP0168-20121206/10626_1 /TAXON_ID=95228 ORGANISM="Vannella sp., Strain DIVA3 517/6/12" /NCGR_SAMPLE_ID=MMETSP0168 /ASSEMBLY_ACC=CAM_ASM_000044 /LENGTH=541 /DNA_ID=CAMNT_0001835431 /DNA_START=130 /DNA_END=1755 /DNA_ORIENTATION=+